MLVVSEFEEEQHVSVPQSVSIGLGLCLLILVLALLYHLVSRCAAQGAGRRWGRVHPEGEGL